MINNNKNNGITEKMVPFGSKPHDYDDDALEIYDESFEKKLDSDLKKIASQDKRK